MKSFVVSKRLRQLIALSGATVLTFGAFVAHAQRIYVNDVDVSTAQLKNWTLNRVEKVDFDSEGNVRITAPSYNVQVVPATNAANTNRANPSSPTPNPQASTTAHSNTTNQAAQSSGRGGPMTIYYSPEVTMAHRYLLTLSNPQRGRVPYDVDVFVNGKHVVTYTHDRGNTALDVSEFVHQGQNAVTFTARRKPGAAVSHAGGQMSIMLGVGAYDGQTATYEHILLGMNYTPADPEPELRNTLNFQISR